MPRGPKPLKSRLKQNQFYCVKCRKRVTSHPDDICVKNIRNRKTGSIPALKSECPKCGTKLFKFSKRKDATKLRSKFGRC